MLTRRRLSGYFAAFSATHAFPSKALSSELPYDLSKPEDNITVFAKIAGSLDDRTSYLQYYGEIFSVIPNQVQTRLMRLKGIAKSRWVSTGDHTFFRRNYDHGLFCDPVTDEVLQTYQNPFTGEENIPLHYKSGPLEATVGPVGADGRPFILPWRITGDQISLTQTAYGERDNYLPPEQWPKASTGPRLYFNTSSTYIADVDDVANESLASVTADHFWTFLTPFPAWMLVGDMPGFALWRWVARKIVDPVELDPLIVAEIEKRVPNFFTVEQPWTDHYNGWIQYTKERQPISEASR